MPRTIFGHLECSGPSCFVHRHPRSFGRLLHRRGRCENRMATCTWCVLSQHGSSSGFVAVGERGCTIYVPSLSACCSSGCHLHARTNGARVRVSCAPGCEPRVPEYTSDCASKVSARVAEHGTAHHSFSHHTLITPCPATPLVGMRVRVSTATTLHFVKPHCVPLNTHATDKRREKAVVSRLPMYNAVRERYFGRLTSLAFGHHLHTCSPTI